MPSENSAFTPELSGSGAVDLALVMLREFVAAGLRHVVFAPGSRSGPLVYAAAALEREGLLECHVRVDERVASFTALGFAKASVLAGEPCVAAVITTSGTAVAHLHAAILEADATDLPLLALTADRPYELLGVGANQTFDQRDVFGSAVRQAFNVPAPASERASEVEVRHGADLAIRATAVALGWPGGSPGPVHVNIQFREPLVPAVGSALLGVGDGAEVTAGSPRSTSVLRGMGGVRNNFSVALPRGPRTIVVVGDLARPDAAAAAVEFAERGGYPLLAEPSSNARVGAAMVNYCGALANGFSQSLPRPDRVIIAGHPTLSRAVMRTLLGSSAEIVIQSDRLEWPDVTRTASLVAPAIHLEPGTPSPSDTEFFEAWRHACEVSGPVGLFADAARAVWAATAPGEALVLGSSSVVRDLEQVAPAAEPGAVFVAQRGLAGIDGTVSLASALDLSGHFTRVRCIVGDVTMLHDANSLIIGHYERQPNVDVVVLNDDGGRIFKGLEHAAAAPQLVDRFFVTPHGTDFAALAASHGAGYVRVTSAQELSEIVGEPRVESGLRILELVPE